MVHLIAICEGAMMRSRFICLLAGLALTFRLAVAQDADVASGVEIAKYILVSPWEFVAEYCSATLPEIEEGLSDEMDGFRRRIELAMEPYLREIESASRMSPEEFATFRAESDERAQFAFSLAK